VEASVHVRLTTLRSSIVVGALPRSAIVHRPLKSRHKEVRPSAFRKKRQPFGYAQSPPLTRSFFNGLLTFLVPPFPFVAPRGTLRAEITKLRCLLSSGLIIIQRV